MTGKTGGRKADIGRKDWRQQERPTEARLADGGKTDGGWKDRRMAERPAEAGKISAGEAGFVKAVDYICVSRHKRSGIPTTGVPLLSVRFCGS